MHDGRFPRRVALLLLGRDVAIVLGGILIYRRRAEIKMAQPLRKATTVAFGASLLLFLVDGPRSGRPALWIALTALAGSLIQYGYTFIESLRHR